MLSWIDERRRVLWIVVIALVGSVPLIWAWERSVGPLPGELWVLARARELLDDSTRQAANFYSNLGAPIVVLVTVVLTTAIVRREFGWRLAALVPAAASVALIAAFFKAMLAATPLSEQIRGPLSEGTLPSGHAAYASALFGLLAVLAVERRRYAMAALCGTLIAGMVASTLITDAHPPSDVLAGCGLGAGWALTLLLVAPRGDQRTITERTSIQSGQRSSFTAAGATGSGARRPTDTSA